MMLMRAQVPAAAPVKCSPHAPTHGSPALTQGTVDMTLVGSRVVTDVKAECYVTAEAGTRGLCLLSQGPPGTVVTPGARREEGDRFSLGFQQEPALLTLRLQIAGLQDCASSFKPPTPTLLPVCGTQSLSPRKQAHHTSNSRARPLPPQA